MKKSQLRKIIRESIKQLMTEQPGVSLPWGCIIPSANNYNPAATIACGGVPSPHWNLYPNQHDCCTYGPEMYRCGHCDTPCGDLSTLSSQVAALCVHASSAGCHAMCETSAVTGYSTNATNLWKCSSDKFGEPKCVQCTEWEIHVDNPANAQYIGILNPMPHPSWLLAVGYWENALGSDTDHPCRWNSKNRCESGISNYSDPLEFPHGQGCKGIQAADEPKKLADPISPLTTDPQTKITEPDDEITRMQYLANIEKLPKK